MLLLIDQAAAPLLDFSPRALWGRYGDTILGGALNAFWAIVILIVGFWISNLVARAIRRWAQRSARFDYTLGTVLSSVARYAILAMVLVAVLQRFGIQTTSIVAMLGAATLAVGLALQGTLSNLAAGVMLIIFRPYRIGDFVEIAGQKGTVREVTLFTTELARLDNVKVVLPNGQTWGAPMINFSANPERRVEIVLSISYSDDIDKATTVVREMLGRDGRVLTSHGPAEIFVSRLGDFSVDLTIRFWVKTPDAPGAQGDALKNAKQAFDAAGITIPYPTSMQYAIAADARAEM